LIQLAVVVLIKSEHATVRARNRSGLHLRRLLGLGRGGLAGPLVRPRPLIP